MDFCLVTVGAVGSAAQRHYFSAARLTSVGDGMAPQRRCSLNMSKKREIARAVTQQGMSVTAAVEKFRVSRTQVRRYDQRTENTSKHGVDSESSTDVDDIELDVEYHVSKVTNTDVDV